MSKDTWRCPFCQQLTTIREGDRFGVQQVIDRENKLGPVMVALRMMVCPNTECRELELIASLIPVKQLPTKVEYDYPRRTLDAEWELRPDSHAMSLPDYVPAPIVGDYTEACRIVKLSPKASATLARRALQGMIRDYWKVTGKKTLFEELEAIKDEVDSDIWDAIDVVRKVGNIGAHMEKDVNVIVDVEPNEAELLIKLIEDLVKDWYIARFKRQQRLAEMKALGEQKDEQRKAGAIPKVGV